MNILELENLGFNRKLFWAVREVVRRARRTCRIRYTAPEVYFVKKNDS